MITFFDSIIEGHDEALSVLVVDDSSTMRSIITSTIKKITNTNVVSCADAATAYEACRRHNFDVVVIDYEMPEISGTGLAYQLRQLENYKSVPMIMITADTRREIKLEALAAGVNDFLNKPFDPVELRVRVSNMLLLRIAQIEQTRNVFRLSDEISRSKLSVANGERQLIRRFARAIQARDSVVAAHILRIARISRCLARGMGLAEDHCRRLYLAAPLHDIGLFGPEAIARKSGPHMAEETAGATELLRIAEVIVAGRHEKWDGSGYPAGLSGDAIPIEARIVAVAEKLDSLCSAGPDEASLPLEKALAEIIDGSGSHFDPACVESLKRNQTEIRRGLVEDSVDDWDAPEF